MFTLGFEKKGSSGISGKDLFDERSDGHIDRVNDAGDEGMAKTRGNRAFRSLSRERMGHTCVLADLLTSCGTIAYEKAILPGNT